MRQNQAPKADTPVFNGLQPGSAITKVMALLFLFLLPFSIAAEDLMLAARHNSVVTLAALANSDNLNQRDSFGRTALMQAAIYGSTAALNWLLIHDANSKLQDNDGNTALDLACQNSRDDCAILLVSHDYQSTQNPETIASVLNAAIYYQLPGLLGRLIQEILTDHQPGTLLSIHEQYSITLQCLSVMASSNPYQTAYRMYHGSPWWKKLHPEFVEQCRTLFQWMQLQPGGISELDRGTIILHASAAGNHDFLASWLPTVHLAYTDKRGNTALHYACQLEDSSVASLLLQHGYEVSHQNLDGTSALMVASAAGNEICVRLLVSQGADTTAFDRYGRSALYFSATQGITQLLLTNGIVATPHDQSLRAVDSAYRSDRLALVLAMSAAQDLSTAIIDNTDPLLPAVPVAHALLTDAAQSDDIQRMLFLATHPAFRKSLQSIWFDQLAILLLHSANQICQNQVILEHLLTAFPAKELSQSSAQAIARTLARYSRSTSQFLDFLHMLPPELIEDTCDDLLPYAAANPFTSQFPNLYEELLTMGTMLEAKDDQGQTAALAAAGLPERVNFLLYSGASTLPANSNGKRLAQVALEQNNLDLAEQLVRQRADLTSINPEHPLQNTPLPFIAVAVIRGHEKLAELAYSYCQPESPDLFRQWYGETTLFGLSLEADMPDFCTIMKQDAQTLAAREGRACIIPLKYLDDHQQWILHMLGFHENALLTGIIPGVNRGERLTLLPGRLQLALKDDRLTILAAVQSRKLGIIQQDLLELASKPYYRDGTWYGFGLALVNYASLQLQATLIISTPETVLSQPVPATSSYPRFTYRPQSLTFKALNGDATTDLEVVLQSTDGTTQQVVIYNRQISGLITILTSLEPQQLVPSDAQNRQFNYQMIPDASSGFCSWTTTHMSYSMPGYQGSISSALRWNGSVYEPVIWLGECLEDLHLRIADSVESASLSLLQAATAIRIQGIGRRQTINGKSAAWLRVSTSEGLQGWLFGAFIKQTGRPPVLDR